MIQTFSITTEIKEQDIHDVLAMYLANTERKIIGFKLIEKEHQPGKVLVFYAKASEEEKVIEYPIKATIPILVEHILQYIREFSIEDVPDLFDSEYPSDTSRLELGINIFKPDWYSDERGIKEYNSFQLFAVQPALYYD